MGEEEKENACVFLMSAEPRMARQEPDNIVMFRHGWQLRTIYSYDYCRLEKGRFKLPEPGTAVWELSHNEMQWLFSGINFMKQKVKKFDKIEYFY